MTPPASNANDGKPGFEEVYARYFPKLERYMAVAIRSEGGEEAGDLAQDALLKAWRHWDGLAYRGEAALNEWLYRISLNVVRDKHRHRSLVGFMPLEVGGPGWNRASEDPLDDPVGWAAAREGWAAVVGTAAQLTELERAVFVACDVANRTMAEGAAALGMSHAACKSTLFRARSRLAARLGGRRRTRFRPAEWPAQAMEG